MSSASSTPSRRRGPGERARRQPRAGRQRGFARGGRRAKPRPEGYRWPGPHARRWCRSAEWRRTLTEAPATGPPRLAAGAVHGDRRPPRRRRVRPGRDGRPLDRRTGPRAGSCAAPAATRVARTRTPTRSRSPRCARPSNGRRRRSSATPGSRSCTSPTARWPTTSRSASCSSARSGPSGRTRSWPPTRRPSSTATAASTTPTIERPGIAAVDAVYPAARNPMAFPWLAKAGLEAHRGPAPVPLLVEPAHGLDRRLGDDRPQARGAARARESDP